MVEERQEQSGWLAKVDLVTLLVGTASLIPGLLLHVLLWSEHFAGLGIYDASISADPAWRARPVLAPLVVLSASILRILVLSRIWTMSPRIKKAYVAVALGSFASLLAGFVPAPRFIG